VEQENAYLPRYVTVPEPASVAPVSAFEAGPPSRKGSAPEAVPAPQLPAEKVIPPQSGVTRPRPPLFTAKFKLGFDPPAWLKNLCWDDGE
jgi:hypothetical protein